MGIFFAFHYPTIFQGEIKPGLLTWKHLPQKEGVGWGPKVIYTLYVYNYFNKEKLVICWNMKIWLKLLTFLAAGQLVVVGETMLSLRAFRHSSSEVNSVCSEGLTLLLAEVWLDNDSASVFFSLQEQIPRLIDCIRLNESQTMQTWCMQI